MSVCPVALAAAAGLLLFAAAALADPRLDYGLPESALAGVEFSGNETYSDSELKRVLRLGEGGRGLLTREMYRPDLIDSQLRLVRSFYRQRGFHQIMVRHDSTTVQEQPPGDILHFTVREGPRTVIDRVRFLGHEPLSADELRDVIALRAGAPAPAELNSFGQDIYRMRSLYWDRGNLRVRIRPEVAVSATADSMRYAEAVTYHIDPGPTYTCSAISISGNSRTQTSLITRELAIEPEEPFAWSQVELSRQNLLATSLFRDVTMRPVAWDTLAARAALQIQVTERRPRFLEFGFGIGSRERIRLQLAWGHNNLWGTGRRVQARVRTFWNAEDILGETRSVGQGELNYRGDVFYRNPHVLGTSYPFDFNLFGRYETRGESALIQRILGVSVGTVRRDELRLTNRFDVRWRTSNPLIHPLAPPDLQARFEASDVRQNQTTSLIHTLLYEGRDNAFDPLRGRYINSQFELAVPVLSGDNTFVKWSGGYRRYRPLFGGVIAGRVRLGLVRPTGASRARGSDGVPYDDRFFAGGAQTVRGYRDNSLGPQITDPDELEETGWGSDVLLSDNPARGGNYLLVTNLEWRSPSFHLPVPLLRGFELSLVGFFDGGNVWEDLEDIRLHAFRLRSYPGGPEDPASTRVWDYRYSLGWGLRFDTPVGPFRMDVGYPLKRASYQAVGESGQTFEDDTWRLHFSLGHAF